jgi:acyl-CoA synthetase (AMP-forming)/AMP-acid ligase II
MITANARGAASSGACSEGNVCQAFDRAVAMYPGHVAVVDGDRTLTYSELGARVYAIARGLRAAGVAAGDRVALLMPNCLEFLPALFGLWRAGAAFTQLSPRAGVADLRYILESVGARALIYHERFDQAVAQIRGALPEAALFIRCGASPVPAGTIALGELVAGTGDGEVLPLPGGRQLAMVGVTSGTTGRPKVVLIDHAAWSYYAIQAGLEVAGPRPGEVFLHVAPLTHVTLLFVLPTWLRGGTNVVLDGFTPDAFADAVERRGVTATAGVPTIIYALLDAPAVLERLGTLSTIVYAGAPMSPARLAEGIARLGRVFVQAYAGTEPGFVSCLGKEEHDPDSEPGQRRLSSAGRPLSFVQVCIQDEQDRELPAGAVGEICVCSPGQMRGYLQPERDQEALRGGWVHSGDLGRLDEDGYLYIVDRKKDMIVTGGMNVFPAQVEALLSTHPAVAQCAVIGVPDDRWGEEVTAFCVLRQGQQAGERELIELVKASKGSVWAPKRVLFTGQLPTTPTGKVDKKALRAPYWKGRERGVN